MYVTIIYLLTVITFVKGGILGTESISVSEHSVSWEEATVSSHILLSSNFVERHGWDSIPGTSPGTRYWIGARAKHTPFVSWEGCGQWIEGKGCGKPLLGGSIGDCLQNCGENQNFFLLKDSNCRCVPKTNSNCFEYTHAQCNRPCPNNPNDWCGDAGEIMSLYYTGPYDRSFENGSEVEGNCAALAVKNSTMETTLFKSENCGANYIIRYICKNESSALIFTENNTSNLGWLEAHNQCRTKGLRLHYDSPSTGQNGLIWTSLRRSILLKWTIEKEDTYPFCVSISENNSIVSLHEEECHLDRHYLYLANEKDHGWWRWWYPFLAVPIAVLLATVVICSVLLCKKSSKKSKSQMSRVQERPPVTNELVTNTDEERSSASLPFHMYHTLERVDSDVKTASDCGIRDKHEMSNCNTTRNKRHAGSEPRTKVHAGSAYNTISGYRGIGLAQNSSNVYNTTLRSGYAGSMPRDYVSCNVYGTVRNKDRYVFDYVNTPIKKASDNQTNAYDVVRR